jgi:replication factor A1
VRLSLLTLRLLVVTIDAAGRSLNASFGSQMLINPDIKPAHELRAWWDSQGKERVAAFDSLSKGRTPGGGGGDQRKSFGQVREAKLGTGDKVGLRSSGLLACFR